MPFPCIITVFPITKYTFTQIYIAIYDIFPKIRSANFDTFPKIRFPPSIANLGILHKNGMPFKITRDKPENIEARRQAEQHEGKVFTNVDDLMKDLLDD